MSDPAPVDPPRPDLAELRALWEAGTSGKWIYDTDGIAFGFYGADDERIMSASGHWSTNAPSDADAALIVAMHEALPELLDELNHASRLLHLAYPYCQAGDVGKAIREFWESRSGVPGSLVEPTPEEPPSPGEMK